jgi:hypothetical protein
MHPQDKRLFQFGDSLYHALEQREGFAMEINAAEMVDSMISSIDMKEEFSHAKQENSSKRILKQ